MSRRRIRESELARLERRAGIHAFPHVDVSRQRLAKQMVTMAYNLEASAALLAELQRQSEFADGAERDTV